MNRLKLLTMATLMALTFTACDEGEVPPVDVPPPPTPVGTISGTVTIDGTGATGITATLSSGATTATGAGGTFSFAGVEAGSYTVTISGYPADAAFPSATQAATIASDGQTVQLNFAGEYIRSSSVVGSVVAADPMMMGSDSNGDMLELLPDMLDGITVTLEGENTMAEPQSTMEGGFAFTGLRAGSYTVTISGFPEDVQFDEASMTVEVGVGEVGMAEFEGAYIRTAAVEGRVIIEGEGLAGVTVTLTGGPGNDNYTKLTGANGGYAFTELRPGDYQVSISGYDPDNYEFASSAHDVSVDLDETETVSFTGVLLRTSGISGRVSVEGMGIAGIAVTLSGAADDTTMTDASGQYAFAGLAAGDYSVSIAVESAAYVFGSMSSDVTVGDDESKIANFEGAHATTASVSGMLFIDELTKNDMHDAGEAALPQAGVPVALVGPGVNDQRLSDTNAEGQFMFSDLRAGPYQLIVPIGAQVAAALAANDLAYGGPPTGYGFALAVGEAKTQAVPFDITHTTVNFTVSLKSGEETGDALPGATVTLYSDAAGTTKVGGGETGEDGSVAIKVTRAGTTGNMVHAGVSADGYAVTDSKTAVSWNPQLPATVGANENDIVNLNVAVTVSGATITTEYGGGKALAGWAISVMMGDSAAAGAPEALDDDGMAAFTATVASVPASFTFAVDTVQDDKLDGGEAFTGTASEYTHTGLSLAGTVAADMIEVSYTTQTLKVYVHHELDQVMGYTGNVLGGDMRDTAGVVVVGLRYINDSGRSREFTKAMWDKDENTGSDEGVWTFSHVPASANVIAQADADEDEDGIMLLDPDEVAAFRNMEDNGVTGGAFGDMGGFSHTVELCPLQATSPQDHDECSSFSFVSTYAVSGLVWKNGVTIDSKSDGFLEGEENGDPTFVPGITVTLSPVEGKNLAGDEESYTSAKEDDDDTEDIDETHMFDFDAIASGAYKLSLPSGWRASVGEGDMTVEDYTPKGATLKLTDELNPLGESLQLDVTPATGLVYGRVTDGEDFAIDSVTVTANGVSTMTDEDGRYILEGISAATRKIGSVTHRNKIFVETAEGGLVKPYLDFAANSPQPQDISLSGSALSASVSGTVRASGTNAPVAGVEITVDGDAPTNKATRGVNKDKLVTGADGTYTAEFAAKAVGESATVRASKAGMVFVPGSLDAPAHPGSEISGIDFVGFVNATIRGRVRGPNGRAMSGVTVTATEAGAEAGADPTDTDTTSRTGTFALNVPFGSYDIAASTGKDDDGVSFDIPTGFGTVNVAPGQTVNVGTIQAKSPTARSVRATRVTGVNNVTDSIPVYPGTVRVTWTADAEDVPAGYADAAYGVESSVDGGKTWTDANETPVADSSVATITTDVDSTFMVRVVATATTGNGDDLSLPSDPGTVAAVNSAPSGAKAVRDTTEAGDATANLAVTWNARSNSRTQQRIVITVDLGGSLGTQSLVAESTSTITFETRSWTLTVEGFSAAPWTVVGTTQSLQVTEADLRKKLSVRVETQQAATLTDADDDEWNASNTASAPADPAEDNGG